MPIYEYKCTKCLYQFERIHDTSKHISECPNCKGATKRLPSSGSFRFGEHVRSPNNPDAVAEATHERKQRRLKGE